MTQNFETELKQHYFDTISGILKGLGPLADSDEGVDSDQIRSLFARTLPHFARALEQLNQMEAQQLILILATGQAVVETILLGLQRQKA